MKIDEVFLCLFEEKGRKRKFRVVTMSLNMTEAIVEKLNKSLQYVELRDSGMKEKERISRWREREREGNKYTRMTLLCI